MKVVLIVLVLVVVLFVVLVVWGHGNNASVKTSGNPTKDANNFNADSYPSITKLRGFFGPLGPKLKPSELTPNPPPLQRAHPAAAGASGKFILSFGDKPTTFNVAPDSKDKYRQATFTVTNKACAIEYTTNDPSGGKLNDQKWPDDGVDPHNPLKPTFQILSAKGVLTVTLKQGCSIQLD